MGTANIEKCSLHWASHTQTLTHASLDSHTHTNSTSFSHTLILFGYAGLDGYKRTTLTVTLEKTVRVKIIPACEKVASHQSICP